MNVGLGSDGAYVNCSLDMVEQMKFAALIQNVTHFDPTLHDGRAGDRDGDDQRREGARSRPRDRLARGGQAGGHRDLRPRQGAYDRREPPDPALVFSAHGTDVDTVFVNGRMLLQGGELVGFDREQEVLAEARARATEVIERAGLADRVFVDWRRGQ